MKIKKIFSLLMMLSVCASVFISCSDDDEKPMPELKLLTESVDVNSEGGEYTLSYQLLNPIDDVKVKADSGAEWITVTDVTDNTVRFTVAANTIYENRNSEIILSYPGVMDAVKCKISQGFVSRPIIELAQTSVEIASEGAEGVEVKYNVTNPKAGVIPEVSCESEWISNVIVSESAIRFDVLPNEQPVSREAKLTVTYKDAEAAASLNIIQAAGATDITVNVGNVTFKMVYIKAGTFMMGAADDDKEANSWEKPAHKVTLTHDYYMGEYEVTQALWNEVMGNNPSQYKDADGDLTLPVENVSFEDVQEFIGKLNEKTGMKFILPTEAQWEYAARGGAKSQGYKYSGGNTVDEVAWYDSNAGFKTHPVGQKLPNELGLYDMCGNVMEWCTDWYGDYSADDQVDPTGADNNSQNYRVARGGGLISLESDMRITFRAGSEMKSHMFFQGFRLSMMR